MKVGRVGSDPPDLPGLPRAENLNLNLTASGARFDGEVLGTYEVRDGLFARAQMFYFDSVAVQRFLATAEAEPGSRSTAATTTH